LIAESIWTTRTNIAAVSITVGFGGPRIAGICSAEYLESFKEGGKRDLEIGEIGGDGVIVRWFRFRNVAVKGGEESLFNENNA
jgi:hypothetical protein